MGPEASGSVSSYGIESALDPQIHLVNLTGSAGSGKTILALAAAIEQTVAIKLYRRIIVTRSTQGLDEDIGFLPGTEEEKMEPWLRQSPTISRRCILRMRTVEQC